jgi:preprotein translocase subunit SecF
VTSVTVFLAVMALLFFGGSVLRNFALALATGIVIGTYSSVFVASPVVALWRGEKMTEVKR